MKIRVPGLNGALGVAISTGIWGWMSTLRYEVVYGDPSLDPLIPTGRPRIYLVWHEAILAPLYLRPRCDCAILVSRHSDADLLEAIAKSSGYACVRGSTNRGGATALRTLAEHAAHRHLVITPDGPRGPRREMASGPIYLAAKLGMPIVPFGVAYDRCWRTPTWDRFAAPKPFTTARVHLGTELHIPTDTDRDAIEASRQTVQAAMMRLTHESEAWAATRQTRPDAQVVKRRRPGPGAPSDPQEPRRLAA